MNTAIENIFRTDFMPHGHCYLWKPEILWLNVVSDVLIALAYFSIPGALYYFVLKRNDLEFRGVFVLFSLFIALCGVTHLISIVVIWNGAYGIHGLSKLATAVVSCLTAVAVYKNLPLALRIPTQTQVHEAYRLAHEEKLKNVELSYQKQQDEILKESANAANFGVMVLKTDGTISLANESVARIFGVPIATIEGGRLEQFLSYHGVDDPLRKSLETKIQGERLVVEANTIEHRRETPSIPVEVSFTPSTKADESVVYVSVQDISLRKEAEKTLQDKQAFMSRVIDASLTGKYIIDSQQMKFEFINSSFSDITGYDDGYLSEVSDFNFIDMCEEGDRKRVTKLLDSVKNTSDGEAVEFEFKLCDNRGGIINVLSKNTVFERDANHKASKIIGSLLDISRLKQAQKKLLQLKNEAEKANAIKSAFLANMSHEIRTPMNAIMGLSTLLAERNLPATEHDYVKKIKSSTHSLLNILNDILDYSKMEAGKLKIVKERFRLNQIVEDVTGLFSVTAEQKSLELIVDFPYAHDPVFKGDAMRISQVLSNLVGNAVKFTQEGFIKIKIEMDEIPNEPQKAEIRFEVKDTGIGIDEAAQRELFQSFTQADSSINRQFGGTGLGLTISNSLLQLMDSKLTVSSQPGVGSSFSFNLTLDVAEKVLTPVFSGQYKTLIVDDNHENCIAMSRVLDSWHFNNDQASSAVEGLRLLNESIAQNEPYNLIIVDWKMPDMDGISFIQKIQSELQYREVLKGAVVLLITGYARELNKDTLEHVTIDAVVEKPFVASRLYDTIASLSDINARQAQGNAKQTKADSRKQFADARVMLVEDNETNQLVATEFLKKFGINPVVAMDGQQAVELFIRDSRFDLIFMDLQMPILDGYSATRKIRSLPQGKAVPIVAMSAAVMKADLTKVEKAGLNGHIPKPIEINHLESVLTQSLAQSGTVQLNAEVPPVVVSSELANKRLDISEAIGRVGNDKRLLIELMRSTCRVQAEAPARLLAFYDAGDNDELQRLVHTLASGLRMVGASISSELAYKIEKQMLASEPVENLAKLANEVELDLRAIQAFIGTATAADSASKPIQRPEIDIPVEQVLDELLEAYQARQRIKSALLKQYLLVLETAFDTSEVAALKDDIQAYQLEIACEKLQRMKDKLSR